MTAAQEDDIDPHEARLIEGYRTLFNADRVPLPLRTEEQVAELARALAAEAKVPIEAAERFASVVREEVSLQVRIMESLQLDVESTPIARTWTEEQAKAVTIAYAKAAKWLRELDPRPGEDEIVVRFITTFAKELGAPYAWAEQFVSQMAAAARLRGALEDDALLDRTQRLMVMDGLHQSMPPPNLVEPALLSPNRRDHSAEMRAGLKTRLKTMARRSRERRKLRPEHQHTLIRVAATIDRSSREFSKMLGEASSSEIDALVDALPEIAEPGFITERLTARIAKLRAMGGSRAEIKELEEERAWLARSDAGA